MSCSGSIERGMRAYVHVAAHPLVVGAKRRRALAYAESGVIAGELRELLGCSKPTSFRLVRAALDLIGFGEPLHPRTHSPMPRQYSDSAAARAAVRRVHNVICAPPDRRGAR